MRARSRASTNWLKDPKRRTPGQQYANLCRNAETVNELILGNGRVNILGSTLYTHKEIKTSLTYKYCQAHGPTAKQPTPPARSAKYGKGHDQRLSLPRVHHMHTMRLEGIPKQRRNPPERITHYPRTGHYHRQAED